MSLEIAVVSDKYAVVVSDGLSWKKDGQIVDEHSQKQIQLGDSIAVAAGGYRTEIDELFWRCKVSYDVATRYNVDPLKMVQDTFESYISSKSFPGFGKTCLVALLVAREPGGFLLLKQHSGDKPEVHHVKPGDYPMFEFCGPGTRGEMFLHVIRFDAHKYFGGKSPEQTIANLREIYRAGREIDETPRWNMNLRVAVLGNVSVGQPCAPDDELVRMLDSVRDAATRAFGRPAEALCNNAINQNGEYSNDSAQSLTTSEAQYGAVAISTNGGNVEVYAKCNIVNSSGATEVVQAILRKDSLAGAALDSSTVTVSVAINKSTLYLSAIDTSPSASQTYVLTAFAGATPTTISNIRIIAANRKK